MKHPRRGRRLQRRQLAAWIGCSSASCPALAPVARVHVLPDSVCIAAARLAARELRPARRGAARPWRASTAAAQGVTTTCSVRAHNSGVWPHAQLPRARLPPGCAQSRTSVHVSPTRFRSPVRRHARGAPPGAAAGGVRGRHRRLAAGVWRAAGAHNDTGTSAVRDATVALVRRAATRFHGAAQRARAAPARLDRAAMRRASCLRAFAPAHAAYAHKQHACPPAALKPAPRSRTAMRASTSSTASSWC